MFLIIIVVLVYSPLMILSTLSWYNFLLSAWFTTLSGRLVSPRLPNHSVLATSGQTYKLFPRNKEPWPGRDIIPKLGEPISLVVAERPIPWPADEQEPMFIIKFPSQRFEFAYPMGLMRQASGNSGRYMKFRSRGKPDGVDPTWWWCWEPRKGLRWPVYGKPFLLALDVKGCPREDEDLADVYEFYE